MAPPQTPPYAAVLLIGCNDCGWTANWRVWQSHRARVQKAATAALDRHTRTTQHREVWLWRGQAAQAPVPPQNAPASA